MPKFDTRHTLVTYLRPLNVRTGFLATSSMTPSAHSIGSLVPSLSRRWHNLNALSSSLDMIDFAREEILAVGYIPTSKDLDRLTVSPYTLAEIARRLKGREDMRH